MTGLARFGDALEAIGYYAERRNCDGCHLCRDDAWGAYIRVGDSVVCGWFMRGTCPDEAEADRRRDAWFADD